jgi:hypothetical protein
MATVFWDWKVVLMEEFMQKGATVTSKVYCKNTKRNAQGHLNEKARNADIRCSAPP